MKYSLDLTALSKTYDEEFSACLTACAMQYQIYAFYMKCDVPL